MDHSRRAARPDRFADGVCGTHVRPSVRNETHDGVDVSRCAQHRTQGRQGTTERLTVDETHVAPGNEAFGMDVGSKEP